MNEAEFRKRFPNSSRSTIEANCAVQNPQPQSDQRPTLGVGLQGKEKSLERISVRFTGFRVRPLDPDNFAGSVKDLLDGLKFAHLIPDDNPWVVSLQTEQEKVESYDQEKTVIEIFYP